MSVSIVLLYSMMSGRTAGGTSRDLSVIQRVVSTVLSSQVASVFYMHQHNNSFRPLRYITQPILRVQ